MYVVRAADAPRVRWRKSVPATVVDSAGAVGSADSFDWRVSIADVETDGPFSAFDGYDRVLVLLDGAGMDLHFTVTGETTRLRPADRRAKFAGQAPIHATLVDGPTSDFNLMSRREGLMATARYGDFTDSLSVGHAGVTAGVYLVGRFFPVFAPEVRRRVPRRRLGAAAGRYRTAGRRHRGGRRR